ncbi:MAG: hypothetical protein A2Z72_05200 [Omnitrophica bacterium RBG_13_46_9]|nr:MAG: hypothetical protein A2Z72_05200 [Omnitrophica bacterium RBG_13_46_9]
MWAGIDRRKFPRVNYKCLIYIKTKDSAKTISTDTENIGVGGICVILDEDLGLFRGVNVELSVGEGENSSIKCSGTVVWVVKKRPVRERTAMRYDTGIEFVDIAPEGKEIISEIVENQLKQTDL